MVYASGTPLYRAYGAKDQRMIALLMRAGARIDAVTPGLFRDVEMSRRLLAGEIVPDRELDAWAGETLAEQLLWGAACGGSPQIVRMCLSQIDWPREDRRWYTILEQPLRTWNPGQAVTTNPLHADYLTCFAAVLERADPNVIGRFGRTLLHSVGGNAARMAPSEGLAFATRLLEAGARTDVRDETLRSTPLGWACRWGHIALVQLLLDRGAPAQELDAEPWATPLAWATRYGHRQIEELLRSRPSLA
jgi:Ankyrin repeats (3 copies)